MKIFAEHKAEHKIIADPAPTKYKNIYNSAQALFYAKKYERKRADKIYSELDPRPVIIRTVVRKYTK